MPEYMSDNKSNEVIDAALHYSDTLEEKISLSGRFGLQLSFYLQGIDNYLDLIDDYFAPLNVERDELRQTDKLFTASRSERTAKQFYNYYADQCRYLTQMLNLNLHFQLKPVSYSVAAKELINV